MKKKINSRDKGARAERELARILRSFGINARRGQQYSGGNESPDIITDLEDYHFEVKRVEKLNLNNAYDQAVRDAKELVPLVVSRKSGKPWLVTLSLEDFLVVIGLFRRKDMDLLK